MNIETSSNCTDIEQLVDKLCADDGATRMKAREQLVKMGGIDVTRALMIEMNDPRRDVRWEAAKALVAIADPIAASALAHHLSDQDGDIRWLAAEGLAELGEPGLLVVLNASMRQASGSDFCKAAHHAFKEFRKHRVHSEQLDKVIEACEASEPGVSLPVAAYEALQQIKVKK